ncbi:MAG: DUF420 domain-containing protein [Rhodobacterales bacterium]|nr:DUF420 domain-containing protein [Rhodobacterales bacterium]
MAINDFPHLLAVLNLLSVILLSMGFVFIRSGQRQRHKAAMVSAIVVSALFLVFYLIYHFNAGLAKFGGEGIVRPIYFTLLIIHVLAAVAIVPLVPWTVARALRGRFEAHRRLARITWPIWMFVGISGVVVYVMTIHMYPYAGG